MIICFDGFYLRRSKTYSIDKCVGLICILPILISVIAAITPNSFEPWTQNYVQFKRSTGFVTSCSMFDSTQDSTYSLLYQRCLLNDFVLMCAILLCFIWTILTSIAIRASLQEKKERVRKNQTLPAFLSQEPNWGRYIPDPPSSIYSASTIGYSGLLIPSTTLTEKKHKEFFCSASLPLTTKIPLTFDYRLSFSDDYFKKEGDEKKSLFDDKLFNYKNGEDTFDKMTEKQEEMNEQTPFHLYPYLDHTSPESVLFGERSPSTPLYSKFAGQHVQY
ncbi:uncharacterized protein B0P05DRAFT_77583 [Gilbertella persicaria]|uniref:uncharacterized protein n=1 Tax=Gilbertella persicaria TaxID=101096 RepID=UPI0022209803|nr:uncharacterized protein B0P05DRAFT_77583 [Gilbertella persicaria]KAI8080127.1 hypothetical protein B0P05DRAFT_77583 [Gilbertella persicaria]